MGVPGPEKLAARFESVARVGWDLRNGAWGEVIGVRGVAPIAGETEPDGETEVALVLPYNPGSDALWPMTELRGALSDHRDWITHPLDTGSDSLYEFSIGDSVSIRLATGSMVELRELVVRPRRPNERLIVGSLWVDAAGGHLVRAAYRPSTPIDLWPLLASEVHGDEDFLEKFGPYHGIVREVIIEHGLYDGRFWLPRVRSARGEGTARGFRLTLSIDQSFSYENVRSVAPGELVRIAEMPRDTAPDGRVRYREWRGLVREGPCRRHSDSSARWSADSLASGLTPLPVMYVQGVRFRVLTACDERDLANSPALPGSIYDSGEALFTDTDLAKLRRDVEGALAISRQAKWSPQPAEVTWGWRRGMARFNRVEGLSLGAVMHRTLGDGYESEYSARIGLADLQPNGEATLRRTNTRSTLRATAFRRLATATEWGDPFALGPSAVALLFGRDDGLYYRTLGAEIGGLFRPAPEGTVWSWRIYAQREDSAPVGTHRSLANVINGVQFTPNIQATAGHFEGATIVGMRGWGSNPRGTRASGLARAEAATGTDHFGRGSAEITLSQGIGARTDAALTVSAGSSLGDVPVQRLWYLGGPQTVRGFGPGAMVGDSFWFGRFEISRGHPLARPSLFADAGWAGARTLLTDLRDPIHGIGAGLTVMEGVIRFDVARSSTGRFRADLYLNPR